MIFIIREKTWKDNAKKLVEMQDYVVCDATSDDSGPITKYANVTNMDGIAIPNRVMKAKAKEDDEELFDKDKLKKYEKNHFKSKGFVLSTMAILKTLVNYEGDINIFVVIKNKPYKHYASRIKKEMDKLFDSGEYELIYLYEDIKENKKVLRRELKDKQKRLLIDNLKNFEKEQSSKPEKKKKNDDKEDKKGKDKNKDKDKKKGKKKKKDKEEYGSSILKKEWW